MSQCPYHPQRHYWYMFVSLVAVLMVFSQLFDRLNRCMLLLSNWWTKYSLNDAPILHNLMKSNENSGDLWIMTNHSLTEYESSSIMANKMVSKSIEKYGYLSVQNRSNILKTYPCVQNVEYELSYCCIGSVSQGGMSSYDPGDNQCHKKDYNKKLKYYDKRAPFTSHDIFWKLPNNSRILFAGDSIQNQIFNGFECDIIRNNHYPFNLTHSRINYKQNSAINFTKLASNWEEIYAQSMAHENWKYHIQTEYHEASNITLSGYRNGTFQVINVLFLRHFRPFLPFYQHLCQWADIYIFQFELHYAPYYELDWVNDIGKGILKILQTCFKQNKKSIFIWNEASGQHFRKISGDYFDIYQHDDDRSIGRDYRKYIAKLKNDSELLTNYTKWDLFYRSTKNPSAQCEPQHFLRNKYLEKHIRRIRLTHTIKNETNLNFEIIYPDKSIEMLSDNTLYFIPFKDYTDPLWDMHSDPDCTHFCSWPQLWQVIWDSIYRIIDKNLSG